MSISVARKTAYKNLLRIECDGSFSSELLSAQSAGISERDLNLIHKLTLGVVRMQILLDFVIDLYSKKESEKLDAEVLVILRLGLFQLLFLDKVPGYSAVNESVELTRFAKKSSASGLVNAVLRKASAWDGKLPELDETERMSIETSHPVWLLEKWIRDFGIKKAREIADANNSEPEPAFRFTAAFDILDEREKAEVLNRITEREDIRKSGLAGGGFVAPRIDGWLRSLSNEGLIYFQDQASQLVGEAVIEKAGSRVLDLCAAPGSKSTQIARSRGSKSLLVAFEINFKRARLLHRNALSQKAALDIVCADGTNDLPFPSDVFDTVLVDAPCSGTGTIRRNPEIRYRIGKDDIEILKSKQLQLLKNASKVLNEKGSIIYSTCSLEREENEDVVRDFIQQVPGFGTEPIDATAHVRVNDGFARTFPGQEGSDGFFIACIRRM